MAGLPVAPPAIPPVTAAAIWLVALHPASRIAANSGQAFTAQARLVAAGALNAWAFTLGPSLPEASLQRAPPRRCGFGRGPFPRRSILAYGRGIERPLQCVLHHRIDR